MSSAMSSVEPSILASYIAASSPRTGHIHEPQSPNDGRYRRWRSGVLKAPALPLHTKKSGRGEFARTSDKRRVISERVVVWGGSTRGKEGGGEGGNER